MDPNHIVQQIKIREERDQNITKARARCQRVIAMASVAPKAGTTPVGWCTKREAEHLMSAPSVAGTGGVFVGVGDFGLFPSWGSCGGTPVPTQVVPRAEFIQALLTPLRQYVAAPHQYTDSVLELALVVEKILHLP